MKVHLNLGKSASMQMMNAVMCASLLDLGHKLVLHNDADVVIGLRDLQIQNENKIWCDLRKHEDKKYILYQVEGYRHKRELVESLYAFGPDEIWGFDIENEREMYTPLGYHPCLLFSSILPEDVDVGFLGWQRGRRDQWRKQVQNKWTILNAFDPITIGENISRARINLNIHYYKKSSLTEWARIAYFLANEQFFISEQLYCPIDVPQFDSSASYDIMVDFYLKHPEERKKRAKEMTKVYKKHFDMRDILKDRLQRL